MQKIIYSFFLIFISFGSFSYQPKENYPAGHTPEVLKELEIKEHLGETIDGELKFTDENGKEVFLKDYFRDKPVLLTIIYYNCPSLCNFHLNGLFDALEKVPLKSGKDYHLVAVTMDPEEKPPLAKEKKQSYLDKYKHSGEGVHFLTGSEVAINSLSKQVGFAFRWDEETEQFAHSPVAYMISPDFKISRYLYGVLFEPNTIKLSMIEAGKGKIGTVIDRVLLFCYRFDPKKSRYTLYAYNVMRLGGALTILILLLILVPVWLREGRKK